ncbi:MAG: cation-efflux pump [Syntrophales bacterium LBB04]|nr:cation-efflux pump [Syntrophales bacterium LBB04]
MMERDEKRRVTLISLGTAVMLIALKLLVGLKTGYLTMLTEALHSSLDALVTVITFFSIRYAEKPADRDHAYGHGKAENLAAFTEAILLFIAVGWIVKEVIERLVLRTASISPSIWAVAVLCISIGCDIQRSRALRKTAEKYKSPAIEADAVHFRADLVSSGVALVGITVTYIASHWDFAGVYSLVDIVTTCLVLTIVVRMIIGILTKSMGVLLDRTAPKQTDYIRKIVSKVPNVMGIERLRTREAGKQTFIDLTLAIDRNLPVESGYMIGKSVEEAIRRNVGDADIILQVKPVPKGTEAIAERIRSIGAQEGCNLHHIAVHNIGGVVHVDLDLEVEGQMTLSDAHALADAVEEKIKRDNPSIREINTHIDWREPSPANATIIVNGDKSMIEAIRTVVKQEQKILSCSKISVEEEAPGELMLTVHCTMRPEENAETVRKIQEHLEKKLKEAIVHSKRVIIHVEPED